MVHISSSRVGLARLDVFVASRYFNAPSTGSRGPTHSTEQVFSEPNYGAAATRKGAKSFIDMFIQRAAMVAAVGLNLGLTVLVITDVRWLSLAVGVLLVAWIWVIRFLGDGYEERKEVPEPVFVRT